MPAPPTTVLEGGRAASGHESAGQRPPRRRSFRESRELESIERELPDWEARRRELEGLLSTTDGSDYGLLENLTRELAELVERIGAAEERWLALSELPG
jgi:ATP-binding cassette subfamily F protein uup